jgi:hypothetical protein
MISAPHGPHFPFAGEACVIATVDLDQKLFERGPDHFRGPTIQAMMEPNARCPTEQNSCLTFLQLARKVSAILPGQVVASGSYKLWFGCMRNGPNVIVFAPNGTAGSISRICCRMFSSSFIGKLC